MFPEIINTAQSYLYRISVAIIILLGGLVFGILVKKLCLRLFEEVKPNQLTCKFRKGYDLEAIVANGLSYLIYFLAFVFFFDSLGLRSLVIYFLILIIVVLFILSSLVGIRDFLPNLRGWVYLKQKNLVKIGKMIEVNGINGKVEKIGLIETRIKTEKGDWLYLPNSLFYGKDVLVK